MKRGFTAIAGRYGIVVLIGLSLGSGGATERAEVAEFADQPGPGQALLDPEVADPFYQDWSAARAASDSEGDRRRASPERAQRLEEDALPRPAGVTTTFFKRFNGAFFQPRQTVTAGYGYFGTGCITATADSYYVHEVQVPDGAVIDFIRFYYYDAETDNATMTVTTYDGRGGSADIVSIDSSGSGGFGSRGTSLNLPVDSVAESIMILYRPNTVSTSMALCGARIRYQYNPLGVIFTDSFEDVS